MTPRPSSNSESTLDVLSPLTNKWVQRVFWILFVTLPILTGWLRYRWLPDESFDPGRHVLLSARDVSDSIQGQVGERPEMWQHRATGEVFTPATFRDHRRREARRLAVRYFLYGLIGCVFFASVKHRQKGNFFEAFGKAVAVNLAAAVFGYFHTLS